MRLVLDFPVLDDNCPLSWEYFSNGPGPNCLTSLISTLLAAPELGALLALPDVAVPGLPALDVAADLGEAGNRGRGYGDVDRSGAEELEFLPRVEAAATATWIVRGPMRTNFASSGRSRSAPTR